MTALVQTGRAIPSLEADRNPLAGFFRWYRELLKFIRREPCWVDLELTQVMRFGNDRSILELLSFGMATRIDSTDGSRTFANSPALFPDGVSWVRDCGPFVHQRPTQAAQLDLFGLCEFGTSLGMARSMNTDLKSICLTEHQVISFVQDWWEIWLPSPNDLGVFFMEAKAGVCMAMVSRRDPAKGFQVIVRSLDREHHVYGPHDHIHVVMPKLIYKSVT